MTPFSLLLFLSAESSWTDPPLWGFPEGQPHRERLLWSRISEHAVELGRYTSKQVFCYPFTTDTQEYPESDVQIDYSRRPIADQERQLCLKSHSLITRLSPDSSVSSVRQFGFVQRCERRAIIVFTGPEQCVILEYFELLWHKCLHTHVRLSIVLFSEKQWSSRPPTSFYEATEERQKIWFLSPWKRTEQVSNINKPYWMCSLYLFIFFTQIKHCLAEAPNNLYTTNEVNDNPGKMSSSFNLGSSVCPVWF